jgi:hypothetical protein
MSMGPIVKEIQAHIVKLQQIMRLVESLDDAQPVKQGGAQAVKPRRTMSAAARKRIAMAQRLRWRRVKAGRAAKKAKK